MTSVDVNAQIPPVVRPLPRPNADLWGFFLMEIGWRGYALDRLQQRFSCTVVELMTGYYARFGNTPQFGLFTYDIVLNAILYTWIYNNTGRSLLAAVLFHFAVNFSGEFLPGTDAAADWNTMLKTIVVAIVVVCWGPRHLVRQSSPRISTAL